MSADSIQHRCNWWVSRHLRVVILVVDVVANTDELTVIVRAGKEDDSDANDVGWRDASGVWSRALEDELVDADWDRPDEKAVQLLVVLGGLGGADVDELPLEVCNERC